MSKGNTYIATHCGGKYQIDTVLFEHDC